MRCLTRDVPVIQDKVLRTHIPVFLLHLQQDATSEYFKAKYTFNGNLNLMLLLNLKRMFLKKLPIYDESRTKTLDYTSTIKSKYGDNPLQGFFSIVQMLKGYIRTKIHI